MFQKCISAGDNFSQVFEDCISRFTQENLELMAVILRRIWLRRNRLVFEGVFAHPSNVYKESVLSLADFSRCNSREGQEHNPHNFSVLGASLSNWQPPSLGVIKINWDASTNKQWKCVGIGVIARDSAGCFLGARCMAKYMVVDPLVAEVMAVLEAIIFAKKWDFLMLS